MGRWWQWPPPVWMRLSRVPSSPTGLVRQVLTLVWVPLYFHFQVIFPVRRAKVVHQMQSIRMVGGWLKQSRGNSSTIVVLNFFWQILKFACQVTGFGSFFILLFCVDNSFTWNIQFFGLLCLWKCLFDFLSFYHYNIKLSYLWRNLKHFNLVWGKKLFGCSSAPNVPPSLFVVGLLLGPTSKPPNH